MTPPCLCVCVLRTMDLPKLIPVISEVAWLRPVKVWRGREGPLIYSMEGETRRDSKDATTSRQNRGDLHTCSFVACVEAERGVSGLPLIYWDEKKHL